MVQWIKKEMNLLGRYSIVGIINTAVGYALIFSLMYFGMGAYQSNGITYFIGFIVSFFLNKKFVFRSKGSYRRESLKFFLFMALAFLFNLAILHLLLKREMNAYVSQCFAGGTYSIAMYLASRKLVFLKT